MVRQALREMVTIEEVLHEPWEIPEGWEILFDADLATKQEDKEIDVDAKNYLFLIYPIAIVQK